MTLQLGIFSFCALVFASLAVGLLSWLFLCCFLWGWVFWLWIDLYPFLFFRSRRSGIAFLSCCFSYVAIFWLFLSFDQFLAMFSWSAWFLDWGDFCYDSPYVGGRPFAGFGAFSDSFIFYYLGIAFGNLWGLFSFMAFFGDFWDLGGFLGAIFWDSSFAIWIGFISGFGDFFTMLF